MPSIFQTVLESTSISPHHANVCWRDQSLGLESCFNSVCRITSCCSSPLVLCAHTLSGKQHMGWALMKAYFAAAWRGKAVLDVLTLQT